MQRARETGLAQGWAGLAGAVAAGHAAVLAWVTVAVPPARVERFVSSPPRLVIERIERAPAASAPATLRREPRRSPAPPAEHPAGAEAQRPAVPGLFLPRRPSGPPGIPTLRELAAAAGRAEAQSYHRSILHDPAFAAYIRGAPPASLTDFYCDRKLSGADPRPSTPAGPVVTIPVDFNRMMYRLIGRVLPVDLANPYAYERLLALFEEGKVTRFAFRDYVHQLYARLASHPMHRRVVLVPMAGYEASAEDERRAAPLRRAKTFLVAFYLDVELRKATGNATTMAHVDRALAALVARSAPESGREGARGSGFRMAHLSETSRASGQDFSEFFRRYVFGVAELPAPGPYLDDLERLSSR